MSATDTRDQRLSVLEGCAAGFVNVGRPPTNLPSAPYCDFDLLDFADVLVILMTMSETLSIAEAKAHLSELVGRVERLHDRVLVTVHGRPSAVLLSPADLEALEETIAVLADTEAIHQLAASEAEIARGEGENADSLAAAMRNRQKPA